MDDTGIYVNCIAKNNIISTIEYSSIYDNITYIKFENEIQNFEVIKKNLEKKPTFRNKSIKIYEAFETNSILVKLNCRNENQIDYLNSYFQPLNGSVWQIPFNLADSPCIIVKFADNLSKKSFF